MVVGKGWKYFFLIVLFICAWVIYNHDLRICLGEVKKNKNIPINVAGIELEVEVAITPEEQILGLMYRDTLEG